MVGRGRTQQACTDPETCTECSVRTLKTQKESTGAELAFSFLDGDLFLCSPPNPSAGDAFRERGCLKRGGNMVVIFQNQEGE